MRAIGAVAPALLDAVVALLDDGNAWAAERLGREPGWVLDAALRHGNGKEFVASPAAELRARMQREMGELNHTIDTVASLKEACERTAEAREAAMLEQIVAMRRSVDRAEARELAAVKGAEVAEAARAERRRLSDRPEWVLAAITAVSAAVSIAAVAMTFF